MVTFTGSTKGGIEVSKLAAEGVKRVSLELGGKSAAIILQDADYRLALKKTLDKVYLNTGQSCSAYSRLLVPRGEKEVIEKLIIEMTKEYKFGDPSDTDRVIGPLSSKKQFDKVSYYINKGIEEGAKLLLGEVPKESKGYFIGPTVFTDVTNDMEIAQNEIFGPVLSIIAYDTVEEAIEIANDSVYGLSGGVFGPEEKAFKVASKIRTGTIVINNGSQLHKAPFGGFKHSGIGREGGKYGLEEFLELKTMFI
jgi:acyl-CoA reductase-like NAD-dependent aldehyde dehydrogenase